MKANIYLLSLMLAVINSPAWAGSCDASLSFSFKDVDFRETDGLALFTLKNNGTKKIEIPLEGRQGIARPHGAHEQLQIFRKNNWEWYAPTLEHFMSPTSALVLAKNGTATIGVDVGGPVIDHVSGDAKFRVEIKDQSGCKYVSDTFSIPQLKK